MPTNLVDVNAFTTPIVVPAGGDARTAASVSAAFQALANRTANAKARLDSPEVLVTPVIAASQDNYSPTGWSTADVVKLIPATSGLIVRGLDSTAVVKFKTLLNTDSVNSISLAHDNGAQAAGNKILCPGNVDLVIGPRSGVRVVQDSVSLAWRPVANCVLSALGAITVIGAPSTIRFVSPLSGSGANWSADASGNMLTTVDASVLHIPLTDFPSGAFITRVRAGISITGAPGAGGGPTMAFTARTPDTTLGTISLTTVVSTVTGPIVAGNAVMTLSVNANVTRFLTEQRIVFTAATLGATQTILNWVEVQFNDMSIWNG